MDTTFLALLAFLPLTAIFVAFLLGIPTHDTAEGGLEIQTSKSPQRLSTFDIVVLYIKAILKTIPGYAPSLRQNSEKTGFALPLITAKGKIEISDEDIVSFQRAVRAEKQDGKGNVMFLVSLTLPLLVSILTEKSCPIKPLGSVNTKNIFRFKEPGLCRNLERLEEVAKLGRLSYQATFGGPQNPGIRRKRGVEFCARIIVFHDGREILEQEIWSMQFLSSSVQPKFQVVEETTSSQPVVRNGEPELRSLPMTKEDPHRWAAVCKDYNPIHVSLIGAKLFGFPSVIAHGNHVVTLVVQQLRGSAGGAGALAQQLCWVSEKSVALEVNFKRPLTLPAYSKVKWQRDEAKDNKAMFEVSKAGKVCVEGACYGEDR